MAWGTFSDIRCINLIERDDRMATAQALFEAVGANVRFFQPHRSPHGGAFGCYESHYLCVKEAYEAGLENVLIFEDDIELRPGWEQVLADCAQFMRSGEDWEALFLGSSLFYPVAASNSCGSIWRAKVFNTHAYVVSRSGMAAFLAHPPPFLDPDTVEHVDVKFMEVWDHAFAHRNEVAFNQSDSPTDNTKFAWLPADLTLWFDGIVRHWLWLSYQRWLIVASTLLPLRMRPVMSTTACPIRLDGEILQTRPSSFAVCSFVVFLLAYLLVCPPPCGRVGFIRRFLQINAAREEALPEAGGPFEQAQGRQSFVEAATAATFRLSEASLRRSTGGARG